MKKKGKRKKAKQKAGTANEWRKSFSARTIPKIGYVNVLNTRHLGVLNGILKLVVSFFLDTTRGRKCE